MHVEIVRPSETHKEEWNRLYAAYAQFYQVQQSQEMRDRVWDWIHDPQEEEECFLAADADGAIIGMAHFRQFSRPLSGSKGGFLDDLFVDPKARGTGAAQKLIDAISAQGRDRGWTVIRWITRDNNYRARAAYDRLAKRTDWLTYDILL